MNIDVFRQILELGWPAIVTIGFLLLAREYVRGVNDEITYLRQRVDKCEGELERVKSAIPIDD